MEIIYLKIISMCLLIILFIENFLANLLEFLWGGSRWKVRVIYGIGFQCADAYTQTFKSLYTYRFVQFACTCECTPKFFSLYSPEDRIECVPWKWHSKHSLSLSLSLSASFQPLYRFWLLPFVDCTPLGH